MRMQNEEGTADDAASRGDLVAAEQILTRLAAERPDDENIWLKLAAIQRAAGKVLDAQSSVTHVLRLNPRNFSALLMRAQLLKLGGHLDEAGEAFGRALANAPSLGPHMLERAVHMARHEYGEWQQRQHVRLQALTSSVAPLSDRMDLFIKSTLRITEPERDGPTHYCYPGLPEIEFYDPALFRGLKELEAAVDDIQREFEDLIRYQAGILTPYVQYPQDVPMDQWASLNNNRDWSVVHLYDRGRRIHPNSSRCPVTMALLDALPQPKIEGAGPNAMFSLLAPHVCIPPHTGVTNTRLVCHLPLIVPEGCTFRVGGTTRRWERGKAWVFDDTIDHEAHNPTEEVRVILIADVWQPDISAEERPGIAKVIAEGSRHIHRL